ncbi:MAG: 4Fe-4S dicluster domain-containing protein [Armatimonadetes bacterium]|nr:4Fe-4S dicluster domain-containing protein [Armatimonadota bacterium]MDW8122329.1 4Fe-4S dicluster domain-containing protein [Armatimonadota bacterium]
MKIWTLQKKRVGDWMAALRAAGKEVLAPCEADGLLRFRPIDDPSAIAVRPGPCPFPFKEWLFPPHQVLFSYQFEGGKVNLREEEVLVNDQVGLFLRPCDAAAIKILDTVFLSDPPDGFYQLRRSHLTIVTLGCRQAVPSCFCPAVGLSPTSLEGSDLFLWEEDDRFLVYGVSEKGDRLVQVSPDLFEPGEGPEPDQLPSPLPFMERKEPLTNVGQKLQGLFESDLWQEVGRTCLGCGICAYLCPTCHCFDIVDESDAYSGIRCRNWDCCAFPLFTLHASGHNPRPDQPSRYRQRVLHKFAYFLQTFQQNMCVGCGRCSLFCPVGMDIYQIVLQLTGRCLV